MRVNPLIKPLHMPPQSNEDYRTLYHREQRKRIILEGKFQRINKALAAGLPQGIALLSVALILSGGRAQQVSPQV